MDSINTSHGVDSANPDSSHLLPYDIGSRPVQRKGGLGHRNSGDGTDHLRILQYEGAVLQHRGVALYSTTTSLFRVQRKGNDSSAIAL